MWNAAAVRSYQFGMNRITEIREQRGLTAKQLAEKIGTTEATISRLATGQRKLTEEWMRKIAKALDVSPTDLLRLPLLEDFQDDAVPYISAAEPELTRAVHGRDLNFWRIVSDALVGIGLKPGDVRLFDHSQKAVERIATGAVVIASLRDRTDSTKRRTVVRQFIQPGLLITNRPGTNIAVTLDHANFEGVVRAVMVDSSTADKALAPALSVTSS